MKRLILPVFAFAVVFAFSAVAFGQSVQRITFKPGTKTKIVTGTLNGYKAHRTFVIRVRKGQTLTTENAGKYDITIGIQAPPGSTYVQDMAADCHDRNEVSPTAKGDYRITVTECVKADRWKGTFKFKVAVH